MGAWGTNTFDNDEALDWVQELATCDDHSLIIDTLNKVADNTDEYCEAPDCCRALAAAEVVAGIKNGARDDHPEGIRTWLEFNCQTSNPKLFKLALAAIDRIKTRSELKDLWDDADEASQWYDAVEDLERRIKQGRFG